MPAIAVVGTQWGDEGKGKVVDLLSERAKYIVRSQGGNNAGHTIEVGKNTYHFHLLPSGIIYPDTTCCIASGVVLDPQGLFQEIEMLKQKNISFEKRLFISHLAHVIFPYHCLLDGLEEQSRGNSIGTTRKGIGPCYQDKVSRMGIRVCDLLSPKILYNKLKEVMEKKNILLEKIYRHPPLAFKEVYQSYLAFGERLSPYVTDTQKIIEKAHAQNQNILYEGAQGALLDNTFGTYPFVTSSSTISGGLCCGAGVAPCRIDQTIGVMKAYMTRVGEGPFPTQIQQEEESLFPSNKESREIGVTTGREREIGWFDCLLAGYGIRVNGLETIALTKLDILDKMDTIKIAIAYEYKGKEVTEIPIDSDALWEVTPIYKELPGWLSSTSSVTKYKNLPKNAKDYIETIASICNVEIGMVSVGPDRNQTIYLEQYFT